MRECISVILTDMAAAGNERGLQLTYRKTQAFWWPLGPKQLLESPLSLPAVPVPSPPSPPGTLTCWGLLPTGFPPAIPLSRHMGCPLLHVLWLCFQTVPSRGAPP